MDNVMKSMPNTVTLENIENVFVIATAGVLVQGGAVTDQAVGVVVRGGVANSYSDVVLFGKTNVRLGGTVAIGQMLTSTTSGYAIASAGTGARNEVAMALEAGVSGDLIEIMFFGSRGYATA